MAKLLEVTTSRVGRWEWMLDSGLTCAQSLSFTVLWPFWALEHLGGHRGQCGVSGDSVAQARQVQTEQSGRH